MTAEEMVMEHRGRPSMTPNAIARRKAAYAANWVFLPEGSSFVYMRPLGRTTVPEPVQQLRVWKGSPKRLGVVKYEPGFHRILRKAGLFVRFESLGDKVAFEDDFGVK